jgi:putative SOS response-associated peptidase YedK
LRTDRLCRSPLCGSAGWDKGGESVESFTIITTAASPALSDIHQRQPAIVDPDHFADWLDPASPAK